MKHFYKIEVYLPPEALENIKNGLYAQGLGKVGNYDCCLSWYEINSSWRPMKGSNPYLGEIGEIEYSKEYKLEFRCEEKDLKLAIETIHNNHPYEEVCVNVIALKII